MQCVSLSRLKEIQNARGGSVEKATRTAGVASPLPTTHIVSEYTKDIRTARGSSYTEGMSYSLCKPREISRYNF